MIPRSQQLIAGILVAPIGAALAWLAIVVVVETAGGRVFAGDGPRNLAEAAATGRADDVIRRLGLGEDPYRMYDVRPEIISSSVLKVTPLEAALWSRQEQMIDMLIREGIIYSAEQRQELACLAADLDLDDIGKLLSAAPVCAAGEAVARVTARATAN